MLRRMDPPFRPTRNRAMQLKYTHYNALRLVCLACHWHVEMFVNPNALVYVLMPNCRNRQQSDSPIFSFLSFVRLQSAVHQVRTYEPVKVVVLTAILVEDLIVITTSCG